MFCTNCGKMIKDTARFCPYCGQEKKPLPQQEHEVQPQAGPWQEQPRAETAPQTAQKSGKKKGGVILFTVLLLLLAIGALGAWFYFRGHDSAKEKERLEEVPQQEESGKDLEGEETEEAIEEMEEAVEEAEETEVPENPDYMEAAQAAYEEGNLELALQGCDDALREDAGCEDAYLLKADIYLEQDNPEEAALALYEGIETTDSETLLDHHRELIGRVVTKSCMQYNTEKDLIAMVQYDDEGNAIRYTYYDGVDVTSVEECVYDSQGQVVSRDCYDSGKKLQWSENYQYDSAGNMLYDIHYNAKGKEEWSDEYAYDGDGNLIAQMRYNADGTRSWWDEYSYESREHVIKTAHPSSGNVVVLQYEYEYDALGNPTSCAEYDESGVCNYSWEKEYNGLGDVIRQSDGREIQYVYEYILQ